MPQEVKVSIIIPVSKINEYIYESVPHLIEQTYRNFEIIIFVDKKEINHFEDKRIVIIPSGSVGPAKKRDLALKYARGEILAFIDDDAYPEKDWIKNAIKNFENENVGAVGGPNLTPENSNEFQKVSGFVLGSKIVSGGAAHRYKKEKRREIDDFPSCNLFIRKNIFKRINGFDSNYWPGEDTKLCLEINKLGKKIVYDPEVVVYHHRRKNFRGYLKQISAYAKHRGNFARKLDKNSFKIMYFVPSLFVLGILLGSVLSFFSKTVFGGYSLILLIYFIILIFTGIFGKIKGFNFFRVVLLIFLTHIIYGIGFIIGILKKDIKEYWR
jgi:GT2 family glycosyltransferase